MGILPSGLTSCASSAILPPLVCGYAVFVAMVIGERRCPVGAKVQRGRPRDVIIMVAGGYLAFLMVVAIFHVGLAREASAFYSALVGGGFLVIVACVAFALLSWRSSPMPATAHRPFKPWSMNPPQL